MKKKQDIPATVFYPENRFDKMARRPGGVPREQALAQAQAQVDEIAPGFTPWLEQEMEALCAAVAELAKNPANKAQREKAIRCSEQMRDTGSTLNFELVTFVAKNLCDILEAVAAGAQYDREIVDCHIDALRLAKHDRYRGLRPDQVPELVNGLLRVGEKASLVPNQKND
jgi:hypothetical protein